MTGIDVSKYQSVIDWATVKQTGSVEFAILRAGFGHSAAQIDSYFDINYKGAKAAGIPVGAYWYSYAVDVADAVKEAKACLQVIKNRQFEWPIYYDMEESTQAALGKETCTKIAEAFCTELEKAGYFVGIYANTNWFNNYLDHAYLSQKYTIWLADYRMLYNKSLKRDMHQYSSGGSVQGIATRVDMNTCTVDFGHIIKHAGLNGFSKGTESAPMPKPTSGTGLKKLVTGAMSEGDRRTIEEMIYPTMYRLGITYEWIEE